MKLNTPIVCALLFLLAFPAPRAAGAAAKKVLFDEGHGQRFVVGRQGELDLSGRAQIFRENGADPIPLRGPVTAGALDGARALVISGPFQPFSAQETDAVAGFVEGGGRLALMLHIPQPVTALMKRLGVTFWNGVVNEEEHLTADSPQDFFISRFEPSHLTAGIERFAAYGAWPVTSLSSSAMVIARTGPRSWIDTNRDRAFSPGDVRDSFGIVVQGTLGKGRFAVFGDDAIFQNRFLAEENRALAGNLARWLIQ